MHARNKNLQDLFTTAALLQRMMHTCMLRTFDEAGIAPSQLQLLHLIGRQQPVSLKVLAADMRLTPGAITQTVDGLVQVGYVERESGKDDRRVITVSLTPTGREKASLLERQKQALLTKVVADLDDDEVAVYLRVQQKMLAYLEANCRDIKK